MRIYRKNITLLLLLVTLLCLSCQDKKQPQSVIKRSVIDFPNQELWNSQLFTTNNGQLSAKINFGYMKRYDEKKVAYFSDSIHVDFYDELGRHTSSLTADSGRLDESTNNVEARGRVVVISDSGITLKTKKLWWDNAIEKIVSDQFVTITTAEQDTFYGVGFESDQSLTRWSLREFRGKTSKKLNLNLSDQKQSNKPDSKEGSPEK